MNIRQIIRDYFTFSRNERKGIIILIFIILLLAIANKLVFYFEKPAVIDKALLDSAKLALGEYNDSINEVIPQKVLFRFNPNIIDSVSLDSLDVPEQIKKNILRYRANGGYFKTVDDMQKVYGMTEPIFTRLKPFIILDSGTKNNRKSQVKNELFKFNPNEASDDEFKELGFSVRQIEAIRKYLAKSGSFKTKSDFLKMKIIGEAQKSRINGMIDLPDEIEGSMQINKTNKNAVHLEINSADTTMLKQLPGIGSILAKRIVKYRDLLGGYYSISQLKEVYGLQEETIHQIENQLEVNVSAIKRIDINFSAKNELSKHPYIKYTLAEKIVKFRSKYGKIQNLEVLRDSMILNIDEYTRIKPYF